MTGREEGFCLDFSPATPDGELTVDLIHCYDDVDRSLCFTRSCTENLVSPVEFHFCFTLCCPLSAAGGTTPC